MIKLKISRHLRKTANLRKNKEWKKNSKDMPGAQENS